MQEEHKRYMDALAGQLVGSVATAAEVSRFTSNTDVIGAYAESLVYRFIQRVVHPLRVSTGTVIRPESFEPAEDTPQFDLIVWDPNPIPALVAEERFALVPKNSVVSLMEVKRTDYSGGLDDIENKVATAPDWMPKAPDWMPKSLDALSIGVVCVRTYHKPEGDNKLARLVKAKKATYLIDFDDKKLSANPRGVYTLLNFLGWVRRSAATRHAEFGVEYPGSTFK